MQEKRKCAVVVSLNPCVDKTVWIDKFVYGGTNRVKRAREDVAGKGTNVCVAFQSLEQPSLCVGFDYAGSKKTVAQRLAECGGACEMVTLPGSMRTNMKLFEEETGIMSEVNEKGDPISAETLQELLDLYQKVLEKKSKKKKMLFGKVLRKRWSLFITLKDKSIQSLNNIKQCQVIMKLKGNIF